MERITSLLAAALLAPAAWAHDEPTDPTEVWCWNVGATTEVLSTDPTADPYYCKVEHGGGDRHSHVRQRKHSRQWAIDNGYGWPYEDDLVPPSDTSKQAAWDTEYEIVQGYPHGSAPVVPPPVDPPVDMTNDDDEPQPSSNCDFHLDLNRDCRVDEADLDYAKEHGSADLVDAVEQARSSDSCTVGTECVPLGDTSTRTPPADDPEVTPPADEDEENTDVPAMTPDDDDLQARLEALAEEQDTLRDRLEALAEDTDDIRATAKYDDTALVEDIEAVQDDVADNAAGVADNAEDIEAVQGKVTANTEGVAANMEAIEGVREDHDALRVDHDDLRLEFDDEVIATASRFDAQGLRIDGLATDVAANSNRLDLHQKGISANAKALELLTPRVLGNEKAIAGLRSDVDGLQSGVAAAMAMGTLPSGGRGISVGASQFAGKTGVAVGGSMALETPIGKVDINAAGSKAGDETAVAVGVRWNF